MIADPQPSPGIRAGGEHGVGSWMWVPHLRRGVGRRARGCDASRTTTSRSAGPGLRRRAPAAVRAARRGAPAQPGPRPDDPRRRPRRRAASSSSTAPSRPSLVKSGGSPVRAPGRRRADARSPRASAATRGSAPSAIRRSRQGVTVAALPVQMGARVVAVVVLTGAAPDHRRRPRAVLARGRAGRAAARVGAAVRRRAAAGDGRRAHAPGPGDPRRDRAGAGLPRLRAGRPRVSDADPPRAARLVRRCASTWASSSATCGCRSSTCAASVDESVGLARTLCDYVAAASGPRPGWSCTCRWTSPRTACRSQPRPSCCASPRRRSRTSRKHAEREEPVGYCRGRPAPRADHGRGRRARAAGQAARQHGHPDHARAGRTDRRSLMCETEATEAVRSSRS